MMRSVRVQPAYDDPDSVRAVIESAGPYWPLARYAANDAEREAVGAGEDQSGFVPPWFRQDFALDGRTLVAGAKPILENPHFIDAARAVFGDTVIVRPITVYVNVMGPTFFPFVAHVDVPAFRGITRADYPVWLLHQMQVSGLFDQWRIRLATAVSWFFDGPGGTFHYWPEGPDGPEVAEEPPFRNVAVVADNEITYHGVSPLGLPEAKMPTDLSVRAELRRGTDGWVVTDDGREVIAYPDDVARITVSWKAEVHADRADAERVANHTDDLTLEQVVDVFLADLDERGSSVERPGDPLSDEAWVSALAAAYRETPPQIT